jgi:TonB family protein
VIAHRLSAAERTDLGHADREEAFGTNMCGDGSRPFLTAGVEDLRGLGPGRPPVDQGSGIRHPTITPPRKIKDAAPIYPDGAAVKAGVRGVVIVEITVDETGRVSRASILRSIPLLDQAAIDCVMNWEYLPTLIDGVPQPTTLTATVSFAR